MNVELDGGSGQGIKDEDCRSRHQEHQNREEQRRCNPIPQAALSKLPQIASPLDPLFEPSLEDIELIHHKTPSPPLSLTRMG
jgi:hypothetical protein